MSIASPTNIFGLSLPALEQLSIDLGENRYRGRQLFQWIYSRGATNFSKLTNINKALRERLSQHYEISHPEIIREQIDPDDGTRKFLVKVTEDALVEMVLIPVRGRLALCMSSQVGCTIGCKFCATGLVGFRRNLTTGEMLGQLLLARSMSGEKGVSNVVMMGMGEPLLNLENVVEMIKIAGSELGFAMAAGKFTISTVGLVREIRELMKHRLKAGLALSLHAPIQELRERLIPSARDNPLSELIPVCREYARQVGDRVTIEYILISGITDTLECAKQLARIAQQLPCKINLIAYNPIIASDDVPLAPIREVRRGRLAALRNAATSRDQHKRGSFTPYDFQTPTMEAIDRFREYLYPRCPAVTFRKAKGLRIAAACGQLVAQVKRIEQT